MLGWRCALLLDDGSSSLTAPGSSDWTWHEVTMPVPGEATAIRFGISLAGHGRIELRRQDHVDPVRERMFPGDL